MRKTALVLEGGAIRGIYTAGVLDTFIKHGVHFPYTVGVSAGAAFGASYISRQIGRNLEINVTYTNDPQYMGWGNFMKRGNFFNFKFIFGDIADHLIPFDYDTFFTAGNGFLIGVTNCETGKCEFFQSTDFDKAELKIALTASSSMPFVSKMTSFRDKLYLDGGIAGAIPYDKAQADGHEKMVIVLTRAQGFRAKEFKRPELIRWRYRKFPALAEAIIGRPKEYNNGLAEVRRLEDAGKAFVIRPQAPVTVGRIEKDVKKIEALYNTACAETERKVDELRAWLAAD
jgi:predicted patatin/cPLA2 family phospholipase